MKVDLAPYRQKPFAVTAQKLADDLSHADNDTRFEIVTEIIEADDPNIKDVLVECLHEGNISTVRGCAASALAYRKDPSTIDPLINSFNNREDETTCKYACFGLGQIGGDKAVDFLTELLSDITWKEIRYFALEALMNEGSPKAILAVINSLNKEDNELCADATRILAGMDDEETHFLNPPWIKFVTLSDGEEKYAAWKYGDKKRVCDSWLNCLESPYTATRQYGAFALGLTGDINALDPLHKLLEDEEPIPSAAAWAIRNIRAAHQGL